MLSYFKQIYNLEIRDRQSVRSSLLIGISWIWIVFWPWGALTYFAYPEYSNIDNPLTRLVSTVIATIAYFIFRKSTSSGHWRHWQLMVIAPGPILQILYFTVKTGISTYYIMGGLLVAGVTTAIFTSIRVALVYVAVNLISQAIMFHHFGWDRERAILLLGYFTLHALILNTLIIRIQALNSGFDLLAQYRHQLEIAKSLSKATLSTVHDLRSPLSILKIIAERRERDEETFSLVSQAVDSISALTNALMKLGKHVVDRPPEKDLQQIDIPSANAILQFVSNLMKFSFAGKIELDLCQGENSLNISSEALERIASNLIKNSVEACEGSGTIAIRSSLLNGSLKLEFLDNGPGIAVNQLSKILTDGFITSKKEGSGVGLQSVLYLIRAHGGDIVYSNNVPGGAKFEVTIPFA